MKIIISILISLLILTGCKKEEDKTTTTYTRDDVSPGGGTGSVVVRPLINFKACPNLEANSGCSDSSNSETGKVSLTWDVPNLYKTEEYIIVLFKLEVGGLFDNESTRTQLQSPKNNLGIISFELTRLKGVSFVDTTITPGSKYLYYGFVVLNGYLNPASLTGQQMMGNWSAHSLLTVQTPSGSSAATEVSALTFWQKRIQTYAGPASNVGDTKVANLRTLGVGTPTAEMPKGRIAIDDSGSTMFVADTDSNRIVVWENANLRQCLITLLSNEAASDPAIRDMYIYNCYLSNMSAPLSAYNILGQPSQYSTLSCQEHNAECETFLNQSTCIGNHTSAYGSYPSFCQWKNNKCQVKGNQCLTKPTDILYSDGKLIISDTGNDRVVMFDDILFYPGNSNDPLDLTTIACDREVIPSQIKPTKCDFSKVFGKKGFDDFHKYDLNEGESSLNGPTGLFVDDDDLYIADTLNSRIVKAKNYYGTAGGNGTDIDSFYFCDESSWLTNMCRWSGLLGQQSYNENITFKDLYVTNNSLLTGTFSNIISEGTFLKRYFRYPTKIKKMEKDNGEYYILVLSNEDFFTVSEIGTSVALRSRILMFDNNPLKGDNPVCNSISFSDGSCSATDVIGQDGFDKLAILSGAAGGAGDYKNVAYGLESIYDFDVKGKDLFAVDGINNRVYIWSDVLSNSITGKAYNYKVLNPEGAYVNATVGNLPVLKGISGIQYAQSGDYIFVVDAVSGYIYHLSFFTVNY